MGEKVEDRGVGQLGAFEQLILFTVVRLGDEAYGLAIRDAIKERTGRTTSPGAIYTTLGRLEGRGLVTSGTNVPSSGRGGRPRRYYTLEPQGARALMDAHATNQTVAEGLMPTLAELAEG